ncbi:MAG: sulfite exporter TauE/SafE family protein [Planctomycetota bacterium]|nr:sulfite exporter TauE/SafE family protein [Planctomycetota bacterium]
MTGADLIVAGLVLAAALIQGVIGFGFGLVVMSVLPRFVPLQSAVPFVAVYGLVVATILFQRYRAHAPLREIWPMVLGSLAGLPLGVLALRNLDPDPCIRALGVFIILFVAQAAWPRRVAPHDRPPLARAWALPAGFLAGIIGGAFAMGGPPVIAYTSARRLSPAGFKGVLQGFFMTYTLVMVGMLSASGLVTQATLLRNLLFAPAIPLGIWLGARYGERLHPTLFRRIVLAALLLLGVTYAVGGA